MFDKKISFVIPCYYSEKTLGGVVEGIMQEFPSEKYNIEIILVNDGSTDGTYKIICEYALKYSCVKGINLTKNFGQDNALMAGYNYSTGDYIVSLDDDQQNPPEEAHKLIKKLEEGSYDVVFGKYYVTKQSKFKIFGSWLNDKMANWLIQKPKDIKLCSYFVMTSLIKEEVIRYSGPYPYVWGLILRCAGRIGNEYIDHRAREIGKTNYTFRKNVKLWFNGFTAFSIKPMRLAILAGCLIGMIGVLFAIVIIVERIFVGMDVEGWTSLISVVLILAGVQLGVIGMMGEYIGRMYLYMGETPLFVVRETTEKIDN